MGKLQDLVGKCALRTKPILLDGVIQDYSYTNEPVEILKITDSHIYYRKVGLGSEKIRIMNLRFLDDNWCEVDPIYFGQTAPTDKNGAKYSLFSGRNA